MLNYNMVDENMQEVLYQAQNMFCLNHGMSPMIFMRLKDNPALVIEDVNMDTPEDTMESCKKYKDMIESGKLVEYIFMIETQKSFDDWCLVVMKCSQKSEMQYVCDIWIEDGDYKFSEWSFFDHSKLWAKKDSVNNLFGQVFCKFN